MKINIINPEVVLSLPKLPWCPKSGKMKNRGYATNATMTSLNTLNVFWKPKICGTNSMTMKLKWSLPKPDGKSVLYSLNGKNDTRVVILIGRGLLLNLLVHDLFLFWVRLGPPPLFNDYANWNDRYQNRTVS